MDRDASVSPFDNPPGDVTAACYQCGVCTAACPWSLVREDSPDIRRQLRAAQLGLLEANEAAWLCTACAQCEQSCPRRVPIADVFRDLRRVQWERREIPAGLPSVLWSMHWNHNPWSQPPSKRMRWAEGLDLPDFHPQQHEILLYVGCAASYDPRGQRIVRALVRLLRSAGVSFGVLGENEPCCGEAALSLGHLPYFEDTSRATAAALRGRGVTSLVTVSPHAFDTFRSHYTSAGFETSHYSTYLTELIEAGRLKLVGGSPQTAAYHDPCLLGRRHQIYEEPRRLLSAIPGVTLVEMDHNRAESLCCGGGGGRMWLETPHGQRFSDLRVREAHATGADVLVTACTFCAACLQDSLKSQPGRGLKVMDLAEVLALAIEGSAARV